MHRPKHRQWNAFKSNINSWFIFLNSIIANQSRLFSVWDAWWPVLFSLQRNACQFHISRVDHHWKNYQQNIVMKEILGKKRENNEWSLRIISLKHTRVPLGCQVSPINPVTPSSNRSGSARRRQALNLKPHSGRQTHTCSTDTQTVVKPVIWFSPSDRVPH